MSRYNPFWSVKYLNFPQELLIRMTHLFLIESKHPEATKNLCYVLFCEGSQKGINSWTNLAKPLTQRK